MTSTSAGALEFSTFPATTTGEGESDDLLRTVQNLICVVLWLQYGSYIM